MSEKLDTGLPACLDLFLGPYRGLDFAHMGFLEQEHAQAALSDTASYRSGEFACEQ